MAAALAGIQNLAMLVDEKRGGNSSSGSEDERDSSSKSRRDKDRKTRGRARARKVQGHRNVSTSLSPAVRSTKKGPVHKGSNEKGRSLSPKPHSSSTSKRTDQASREHLELKQSRRGAGARENDPKERARRERERERSRKETAKREAAKSPKRSATDTENPPVERLGRSATRDASVGPRERSSSRVRTSRQVGAAQHQQLIAAIALGSPKGALSPQTLAVVENPYFGKQMGDTTDEEEEEESDGEPEPEQAAVEDKRRSLERAEGKREVRQASKDSNRRSSCVTPGTYRTMINSP